MTEKRFGFPEKIEISEIVQRKIDEAFEQIEREEKVSMKYKKDKHVFVRQIAAAAAVCAVMIGGVSAAAAIHHYWGRGMQGNIQATDDQQQQLTDDNVAKVYRESPNYVDLAVTENGVTIAPDTVIVDERFAYLSFTVSGCSAEEGAEPGFEEVSIYRGDDPSARLDMSGTMYNGIISDERGTPVYEDGSPIEMDASGGIVYRYTDKDGNMEYIIQAKNTDAQGSLLGEKVHISLKNLGTLSNASFSSVKDGTWELELTLPEQSSSRSFEINEKVPGTDFVLESASISPISMRIDYSASKAPDGHNNESGIPAVRGVVLKDGTKLPYLLDGGSMGYTDSTQTKACQMAGYDRVVDVDNIAALIIATAQGTVEMPITK